MADKKYRLDFELTDGTVKSVEFTAPQGEAGKSAYEYAKDAGYTGSESEFAEKIAAEYVKTVNNIAPGEDGNVDINVAESVEDYLDENPVEAEVDFTTDEEVKEALDDIFDGTNTDGGGDSEISDTDFATDEEVNDMIDDVFGE